jgi:hypothetical protein
MSAGHVGNGGPHRRSGHGVLTAPPTVSFSANMGAGTGKVADAPVLNDTDVWTCHSSVKAARAGPEAGSMLLPSGYLLSSNCPSATFSIAQTERCSHELSNCNLDAGHF